MSGFNFDCRPFRLSVSFVVALGLVACGGPLEEPQRADAASAALAFQTQALLPTCPSNLVGAAADGACTCPPVTNPSKIWGTGVYTDDSHLCTAAVHSGVISASTGGDISYTLLAGRSTYCGSTRHEVTSSTYNQAWTASYSVGGVELTPVEYESVYHTYSARRTATNIYQNFSASVTCKVKPIEIRFTSANDGQLLAIVGDGTEIVLDDGWYPSWDSYTPTSTTRSDCPSVCPH